MKNAKEIVESSKFTKLKSTAVMVVVVVMRRKKNIIN
jgi:hypothetical protein